MTHGGSFKQSRSLKDEVMFRQDIRLIMGSDPMDKVVQG